MVSKISKTLVVLFLFVLPINTLIADADLERSNLAKLVYEIDFLLKRVDQIKQVSSSHQSHKFHYHVLKEDLKKIKTGINNHINLSLKSGRVIKPLSGNYIDKSIDHE
jgi:RAQPRD family integrative conjugative element protein